METNARASASLETVKNASSDKDDAQKRIFTVSSPSLELEPAIDSSSDWSRNSSENVALEEEIWSWGAGTDGQLATGRLEDDHSPQLLRLGFSPSLGRITSLACSGAHGIALTSCMVTVLSVSFALVSVLSSSILSFVGQFIVTGLVEEGFILVLIMFGRHFGGRWEGAELGKRGDLANWVMATSMLQTVLIQIRSRLWITSLYLTLLLGGIILALFQIQDLYLVVETVRLVNLDMVIINLIMCQQKFPTFPQSMLCK